MDLQQKLLFILTLKLELLGLLEFIDSLLLLSPSPADYLKSIPDHPNLIRPAPDPHTARQQHITAPYGLSSPLTVFDRPAQLTSTSQHPQGLLFLLRALKSHL